MLKKRRRETFFISKYFRMNAMNVPFHFLFPRMKNKNAGIFDLSEIILNKNW